MVILSKKMNKVLEFVYRISKKINEYKDRNRSFHNEREKVLKEIDAGANGTFK